jgi:hypothetical protein
LALILCWPTHHRRSSLILVTAIHSLVLVSVNCLSMCLSNYTTCMSQCLSIYCQLIICLWICSLIQLTLLSSLPYAMISSLIGCEGSLKLAGYSITPKIK